MVIILCENFLDAENAFNAWLSFLQETSLIRNTISSRHSLRVDIDDDLIYIFIDNRFWKVFDQDDVDIIAVEDFLGVYGVEDPDPLRREWRSIVKDIY